MSSAIKIGYPPTRNAGATRLCPIPSPLRMHRGGLLPHAQIAYETWGRLSPAKDNAVLIYTGLSPSAHAASSTEDTNPGWWEYMLGPGKPIDTNRYFVICVNSLGSCFGSTGPASINRITGQPYGVNFPELAIEDIAGGGREVVSGLGITRLHTVVGASLGGMAALAFAIAYSNEVGGLVSISAGASATPFAIAIRSLQRELIRSDPAWNHGNYSVNDPPTEGMRLARKLGLTSYRSALEWQQRFGRQRSQPKSDKVNSFDPEFEVESYLEYNAVKFAGNFDPNCYLFLSRAMDWFDVAEHGAGDLKAGFEKIKTRRNLIIGVESDFLFPIWQQEEIADILKQGQGETTFVSLPSVQGHDAFLADEARFAAVMAEFFATG